MRKIFEWLGVQAENRGLLVTINLSFFFSGLMMVMLGAILPFIRSDYALSYTQTGLIFSFHQVGNLTAVLAAGVLPYWIGRKRSTLLLSAGATLGLTLAIVAGHPLLLMVAFAFTGIGRGTFSNICNAVNTEISSNKTAALNVLHSGYALGALISPMVVFAYVSVMGSPGWRFAVATVAFFMAVAWLLILRSELPPIPPKKEKGGSFTFLKHKSFWIPTMLLFFYLAVEVSIVGWFVVYFLDIGVLPPVLSGFVPTFHWSMVMVGRLFIASISLRVKNKNMMLVIMAFAALFSFTGLMLSATAVSSVIFLVLLGLSLAGVYPTTIASMTGENSAVSIGFTIAIATFGGILMPSIIGVLADVRGISEAIALVLVVLIVVTALAVVKIFTERQAYRQH